MRLHQRRRYIQSDICMSVLYTTFTPKWCSRKHKASTRGHITSISFAAFLQTENYTSVITSSFTLLKSNLLIYVICFRLLLLEFAELIWVVSHVTLTCEHDVDRVRVNQHAKYLGHLVLKLLPRNTDRYVTHTGPITLFGPLKWWLQISMPAIRLQPHFPKNIFYYTNRFQSLVISMFPTLA